MFFKHRLQSSVKNIRFKIRENLTTVGNNTIARAILGVKFTRS